MSTSPPPTFPPPPGASARAADLARRVLSPIEAFLHVQAASGIVLLVATAIALFLANGPLEGAYHHALETPLGFHVGAYVVELPVHLWIDDGLMTLFFFVVGLEIRREIHGGELANLRRAALPMVAALGGMVAPALIYLGVNLGHPESRSGWGVPMATDIAFAVGILALLGKRVPPALRVLLLALAIIDDIGSILVIALFYSGNVDLGGLALAAGGILGILLLQRFGVRRIAAYVVPGFIVWLGTLRSGVHPTIAGVIVGLLTPARSWLDPGALASMASETATLVTRGLVDGDPGQIDNEALHREAKRLDFARKEAFSPAERLQLALHPWVAFGIMPIFAVANAGVHVSGTGLTRVSLGIVLGLVVGKPVGILAACKIGKALGFATPRGIGTRELFVLGTVAGIGFTMALFVAALAFEPGPALDAAKTAVLVASAVAMAVGLGAGFALLGRRSASPATSAGPPAVSLTEAEQSDVV